MYYKFIILTLLLLFGYGAYSLGLKMLGIDYIQKHKIIFYFMIMIDLILLIIWSMAIGHIVISIIGNNFGLLKFDIFT